MSPLLKIKSGDEIIFFKNSFDSAKPFHFVDVAKLMILNSEISIDFSNCTVDALLISNMRTKGENIFIFLVCVFRVTRRV